MLNKALAAAALIAASAAAQAVPVTVNSLSRDVGVSNIIVDSLNHREWLGWDVTRHYTSAQLATETAPGGQFAGFKVAHVADAQMFTDALLGPNACSVSDTVSRPCATAVPTDAEALVGETYFDLRAFGFNLDYDYVFFVSDNGVGLEVGYIELLTADADPAANTLSKNNEVFGLADADLNASNAGCVTNGIDCSVGFLLYRETSRVPEPGTPWLAFAGLAAAFATGRRRRNARS